MQPNPFITFEGGEGAGKSTQISLLAEALTKQGFSLIKTREPGGAPGAEALRNLLLFGPEQLSLRAEIMVHYAARCDHIDKTILPARESGKIVLCDRFTDSTCAYQGYGMGKGDKQVLSFIAGLNEQIDIKPDLTFFLHLPRTIARERIYKRAHLTDRYEANDEAFHERVEEGFVLMAEAEPQRFRTINADGNIEEIHETILGHVIQFLSARG